MAEVEDEKTTFLDGTLYLHFVWSERILGENYGGDLRIAEKISSVCHSSKSVLYKLC